MAFVTSLPSERIVGCQCFVYQRDLVYKGSRNQYLKCLLGAFHRRLHVLFQLPPQTGRGSYYLHFAEEETELQGGQVTCSGSQWPKVSAHT